MTDITELATVLRLAAESEIAYRAEGDTSDLWQDEVSPDNILALVEALEKAHQQIVELQQGYENDPHIHEIIDLKEHIAELDSSGIAPGIMRCTECSFVQTKNIINVTADTITTGISEPEPCPNGCGQLQPVTWKALAIQLMFTTKQGLSDLLEAKKRIEELESDLSEWTDCKHDGATYYDMSGREPAEDAGLKAFVDALLSIAWQGGSADGADIQNLALKHGLLRQEVYSADEHENQVDDPGNFEDGDPVYFRVETPATDAFLAEVRAQGVEMCSAEIQKQTWDEREGDGIVAAIDAMENYASQLRKGDHS